MLIHIRFLDREVVLPSSTFPSRNSRKNQRIGADMQDKMRFGIIGCGHWGKNYVRVLQEIPGAHVVRVADKMPQNLDIIQARYPQLETTTEFRDVCSAKDLQAVIIATSASTHFEIARVSLEAGQHTLVEKPLCLSTSECRELVELAAKRQCVLMVGHTFLYNDSVRKMKQILEQTDSGRLYYLQSRRNHLGLVRDDVSVLWDLAAHDIAVFSYLLDLEPESVSAVGQCFLHHVRWDVAFITLRYPGGMVGNIQVSWLDAQKVREVVAITERRRIVYDDLSNLESLRIFEKGISKSPAPPTFGEFQYHLRDGDIISPRFERHEPLRNLCEEFLASVRSGKSPLTDGHNGLAVVRVLEAASRSIELHGAEVPV